MKTGRKAIIGILAGCAMLIMILDTKTALEGGKNGLQLCLNTVIPSLFPFIFLSGMLNSYLLGRKARFLTPIRKLCNIPKGGDSLLLMGFLAGYPVGAQSISHAYQNGKLSAPAAKRMLGFCNNAGPAFLFGMFSVIFSNAIIPWVLWSIHIFSALTVGFFLPGKTAESCQICTSQISIHSALEKAIRIMAVICGWIVLFRMVIAFCERWFLWLFPVEIQILFSGFLELSNGIIMLQKIPEEGVRFLLACPMLAFGGICVGMQTRSVTAGLGCGYYFPGKVLQALFSLLFAIGWYPVLFKKAPFLRSFSVILILLAAVLCILCVLHRKKLWHLWKECCIILLSVRRKEQIYAVSEKNNTLL